MSLVLPPSVPNDLYNPTAPYSEVQIAEFKLAFDQRCRAFARVPPPEPAFVFRSGTDIFGSQRLTAGEIIFKPPIDAQPPPFSLSIWGLLYSREANKDWQHPPQTVYYQECTLKWQNANIVFRSGEVYRLCQLTARIPFSVLVDEAIPGTTSRGVESIAYFFRLNAHWDHTFPALVQKVFMIRSFPHLRRAIRSKPLISKTLALSNKKVVLTVQMSDNIIYTTDEDTRLPSIFFLLEVKNSGKQEIKEAQVQLLPSMRRQPYRCPVAVGETLTLPIVMRAPEQISPSQLSSSWKREGSPFRISYTLCVSLDVDPKSRLEVPLLAIFYAEPYQEEPIHFTPVSTKGLQKDFRMIGSKDPQKRRVLTITSEALMIGKSAKKPKYTLPTYEIASVSHVSSSSNLFTVSTFARDFTFEVEKPSEVRDWFLEITTAISEAREASRPQPIYYPVPLCFQEDPPQELQTVALDKTQHSPPEVRLYLNRTDVAQQPQADGTWIPLLHAVDESETVAVRSTATYGFDYANNVPQNLPIVDWGGLWRSSGTKFDSLLCMADGSGQGELVGEVTELAGKAALQRLQFLLVSTPKSLRLIFQNLRSAIEAGHEAIIHHKPFETWPVNEPPKGASTLLLGLIGRFSLESSPRTENLFVCASMGDCQGFRWSRRLKKVTLITISNDFHVKSTADAGGQIGWTFQREHAKNAFWPHKASIWSELNDKEVEEVRAECRRLRTVMGTVDAKEITYHAIPVEPGDIIFLVTDGVTDNCYKHTERPKSNLEFVAQIEDTLTRWIGLDPLKVSAQSLAETLVDRVLANTKPFRDIMHEQHQLEVQMRQYETEGRFNDEHYKDLKAKHSHLRNSIRQEVDFKPDHTTVLAYTFDPDGEHSNTPSPLSSLNASSLGTSLSSSATPSPTTSLSASAGPSPSPTPTPTPGPTANPRLAPTREPGVAHFAMPVPGGAKLAVVSQAHSPVAHAPTNSPTHSQAAAPVPAHAQPREAASQPVKIPADPRIEHGYIPFTLPRPAHASSPAQGPSPPLSGDRYEQGYVDFGKALPLRAPTTPVSTANSPHTSPHIDLPPTPPRNKQPFLPAPPSKTPPRLVVPSPSEIPDDSTESDEIDLDDQLGLHPSFHPFEPPLPGRPGNVLPDDEDF